MGPLTLVGLAIFVLSIAIVANDYSRIVREHERERERERDLERSGGYPLPIDLVGHANDPLVTNAQSQAQYIATLLGAVAGGAAGASIGRGAGTAISAAEVELARGLGSQEISTRESRELTTRSAAAGSAAGGATGANVGGAAGGFGGGFITTLPLAFVEQAGNVASGFGERVIQGLAEATPSKQLYDVPVVGGFWRGVDTLFGGRP